MLLFLLFLLVIGGTGFLRGMFHLTFSVLGAFLKLILILAVLGWLVTAGLFRLMPLLIFFGILGLLFGGRRQVM